MSIQSEAQSESQRESQSTTLLETETLRRSVSKATPSFQQSQQKVQLTKKTVVTGIKAKTEPKTILIRRPPQVYSVVHNGTIATPQAINPDIFVGGRERQLSTIDISSSVFDGESTSTVTSAFRNESVSRLKSQLHGGTVILSIAGSQSIDAELNYIFEEKDERDAKEFSGSIESVGVSFTEMQKLPSRTSLILKETSTSYVFHLPSSSVSKDDAEGEYAETENKYYEFLTSGRGRNRKMINAEVQTISILLKSRGCEATVAHIADKNVCASYWQMFDMLEQEFSELNNEDDSAEEEDDEEEDVQRLLDFSSVESLRMTMDEKLLGKLVKNDKFLEACSLMERVLANNNYKNEQRRFRDVLPKPITENIKFNYRTDLLWNFANTSTKGFCVTGLQWNPKNTDILAAAYGKFYFDSISKGLVLLWSIKNPVQPERHYTFSDPVTTLSFSICSPHLLAIGFYNGNISVINVAERELKIVYKTASAFEPVWNIIWHSIMEYNKANEQLIATFDDGRVMAFKLSGTKYLNSQQIMRVAKSDGKLKGINTIRKCSNINIPVSRYCAALILRPHPQQLSIYYVCTREGVIYRCSTYYLNQHLDLFLAHEGATNVMKFSPFCSKIFATCGDDWHIRIWAEGMHQPLIDVAQNMESVGGIDWSPLHSTVLVSISGKNIFVWDLQRKVYEPQSITISPNGVKCTVVQFAQSGSSLVVGDVEGNVQLFALEEMPMKPHFQKDLLYQALRKALITKPDLVHKLKKILKSNI